MYSLNSVSLTYCFINLIRRVLIGMSAYALSNLAPQGGEAGLKAYIPIEIRNEMSLSDPGNTLS